jgi:hypothetical protein
VITPGTISKLAMDLDAQRRVTAIEALPMSSPNPAVFILTYQPPTPTTGGAITLGLTMIGAGNGLPGQSAVLRGAPVSGGEAAVYSLEGSGPAPPWRRWTVRADLDASTARDAHVRLEPATGELTFGDGVRGRVVPETVAVLAMYETTSGAAGIIPDGQPPRLADDTLNRVLLGADFAAIAAGTMTTVTSHPGTDAEDVGRAASRAAATLWAHERLVELAESNVTLDQLDRTAVMARHAPPRATTTLDFERLALDVPGTRIARARAWAQLDPDVPDAIAPGTITVVVVPRLPRGRPSPSAGLLRTVRRYLDRRRILCTRLVVVGPHYLEITVRATVRLLPSGDPARVGDEVRAALNRFLDPLLGGPAGLGWPFGRDVYRSEILQAIDRVPGVDHVLALSLVADDRDPQCDNVCVPPTWLVASGSHEIVVEGA